MADTHIDLPGSRRPAKPGAQRVRALDPETVIEVTLDVRAPPLPKAHEIARKAVGRTKFAELYGAKLEDVHKVRRVLRGFGLHVTGRGFAGRSLRVRGAAAAIEAAFQPDMAIYHAPDQGEYRGRSGTIKLPAELAGLVTGAFGLDQRRMVRKRHGRRAAAAAGVPLTPDDLEKRYNFPANDAAGQGIAIAEFSDVEGDGNEIAPAYFPDDVLAFCKAQGRKAPKIVTVPAGSQPLTPEEFHALPASRRTAADDGTKETMMDIEIAAALAPGADIQVYYGKSGEQGWVDLLSQVIDAGGQVPVALSISWGDPEDSANWSQGALEAIDARLQALAALGVTVCVAAGDDGSSDGAGTPGLHVDFPAASPNCLAVGGTMLDGNDREVVWWEKPGQSTTINGQRYGGATGGGISTEFPQPSWQAALVVPGAPPQTVPFKGRILPDVAALAGAPNYALRLFGHDDWLGGTSAAAPLWAALLARVNAALPAAQRQRFLTPLLYQKTKPGRTVGTDGCRDITDGHNISSPVPGIGYAAARGFDAVTGWGVPDGKALLAALAALPPPTTSAPPSA
jgi:kumamolisin